MTSTELSVIIPMRNFEKEITGVLLSASSQSCEIDTEFIVVDMGSSDSSVLETLKVIKDLHLKGCVVQNGNVTIPEALNTGITKALGQYLAFFLPERLYSDFLLGCIETARSTNADFIFAPIEFSEGNLINTKIKAAEGAELLIGIIQNKVLVDIGATVIRRKFVTDNQCRFVEVCKYGFSEEFLMNIILTAGNISKSSAIAKRNHRHEVKNNQNKHLGMVCFDRVEAMRRVYETIRFEHKDKLYLNDLFLHQKIPDTLLDCVDILLNEGLGYNAIKGAIKLKKYEKLFQFSSVTDPKLKNAIRLWKIFPWLYRSRLL